MGLAKSRRNNHRSSGGFFGCTGVVFWGGGGLWGAGGAVTDNRPLSTDKGALMETVRIFDTTLRDGEQSPGATLTLAEKLEVARHLEAMGVDIIEAGFPISSEGDFESVRQIAQEVSKSTVCGLARCVRMDVERAAEAVKPAAKPRIPA